MPAIEHLDAATPEEVDARLEELRGEFTNLNEGLRSGGISDRGALRSMLDEVDVLDTWNTLSAAKALREQQKLAATAGALQGRGHRTIGDAIIGPDFVDKYIKGSTHGPLIDFTTPEGRKTRVQHVTEIEFSNDKESGKRDGTELSQWLRYAGIFGSDAVGYRTVTGEVTEWGSGGPPSFDTTDSGGLLPRLGQPIPPVPRQAKLYLRDLMPSMTTTLATIPYVRELNPAAYEEAASGGATPVAEGSVKPTAQLSFVSENAPVTVVAATLVVSKQMFEDAPAVVQYINQRLPYLVKFAEDAQFLNGDGTWPAIQGILNTSGIQSYAGTSAEDYAVDIGNAFALVENEDGAPTAVVMNPTNAWYMFTKRAAGGAGTFDAGTPFSALPLTVWGVQSYRSRAYPEGTALVSDFTRGAMVIDREQVNVQVYNERYAEQNLVLLICEERVGEAIFRPDLFVQTTLS